MVQANLKQEVALLRSALAGLIGKDKEGQYRPEFVEEMYKELSRKPSHTFNTEADFLNQLKIHRPVCGLGDT